MSVENNLKKIADNLEGIRGILADHYGEPDPTAVSQDQEKKPKGRPPLDDKKPKEKPKEDKKSKETKITSKEFYDLAVKATRELGVEMKTLKDILAVYGVKAVGDVPEDKLEEAKAMLDQAIAEASQKQPPEDDENPF